MNEYFSALFESAAYWLLAYGESGGGALKGELCALFGAEEGADFWKLLEENEKALTALIDGSGGHIPRFESVCARFELNPFQRLVLTLAISRELDAQIGAAIRLLGGELTLGLALLVFSRDSDEAFSLHLQWLSRRKTLELLCCGADSAPDAPLRVRPCVLRYILGLDFDIDGAEMYFPRADTAPDGARELFDAATHSPDGTVIVLSGPRGAGKKRKMRLLSDFSGRPSLFVRRMAPDIGDILAALAVTGAYLCVTEAVGAGEAEGLIRAALNYSKNVFLTTELDEVSIPGYNTEVFRLGVPDVKTRRGLWRGLLAARGHDENAADEVSEKYAFTPGVISSALDSAETLMRRRGENTLTPLLLDEGCALRLPKSLSALMKEVPAVFGWDDLVLPEAQKKALGEACARVKHAAKVYEDWGFGEKLPYGRGMRALFSGPPGTGKTMAAQVMASELRMRLYKVNLAALVSKYIGETEKNLAALFEDARRAGGILFFDEADALFGSRVELSDSHDRFANMQTAYLLQAVEDYEGVLILATNLAQNLDEAFARRIQCRVDFTPPDIESRRGIWARLMDGRIPLGPDIDTGFLAESFELTGAEIKNICLTAAFYAASREKNVGMREVIEALRAEYAKMGKILSADELERYL